MQKLESLLNATVFQNGVLTSVLAVILVAAALHAWAISFRKRRVELEVTKRSLRKYYDAANQIVDDPAAPLSVLEFISDFSEVISNESYCRYFADRFAATEKATQRDDEADAVSRDLDLLAKSRPDLKDAFSRLLSNGLMALFLRWPGGLEKIERMLDTMGRGERDEVRLAYRFTTAGPSSELTKRSRSIAA